MSVFYHNVAVQLVLEGISQKDTLCIRQIKPKFPAFQCPFCFHAITLNIAREQMVCLQMYFLLPKQFHSFLCVLGIEDVYHDRYLKKRHKKKGCYIFKIELMNSVGLEICASRLS